MKGVFAPKRLINIGILLFLFFVSVLIRLDNLKDPMGRHGEWLTGHVLGTVYILEQDGAASHYFSPVFTFNNEADRYVQSKQSFRDKNNFTYYVSYPPLCFLFPYAVFKTFGLPASVLGIRVINLVIHFFTGLFIFLILYTIFRKRLKEHLFVPAYVGFFLYIFACGNLWFHGHVWFADMLVPLFITAFLWVLLKTIHNELRFRTSAFLLFILCFLGCYTEWQMLFVAFFSGILFLLKGFKEKRYWWLFVLVGAAAVLPVVLTYYQYTRIAGPEELFKVISAKYEQRSGVNAAAQGGLSMNNSFSYINLADHYETNYSTLLDFGWYCLLGFAAFFIIYRLRKETPDLQSPRAVFVILLLSIVLHHVVFFNFTTVHDFSTLKTALFISLFGGYTFGLAYLLFDIANKRKRGYFFIGSTLVACALFFHFSTKRYYLVNQESTLNKNHIVIGEVVRRHIKPNEIVFCTILPEPQASWYAKRNLIGCYTCIDAAAMLKNINSPYNGQVIQLNAFDYDVFKINTRGDTIGHVKEPFGILDCLKK